VTYPGNGLVRAPPQRPEQNLERIRTRPQHKATLQMSYLWHT